MLTLDRNAEGGTLVITADHPLDRDVVKTINGVTASGSMRWTLPAALPCAIEAEMTVVRDGGELTPAFVSWRAQLDDMAAHVGGFKSAEFPRADIGEITLKPEQEQDAQFLRLVGSGLILNEMRTGKTFTLLRTLDLLDAFPALIATLPSTTYEIARQCRQAFPTKNVVVVPKASTATQRKRLIASGADVLVVGHNILELHSKILPWAGHSPDKRNNERTKGKFEPKELNDISWKSITVDEAHAIENPGNASTRAAWYIGDSTPHRFVLTGTPAANHEDELWSLLRFCYPTLFPARSKWITRWINLEKNAIGKEVCRAVNTVGNDGVKRNSGIRPEVRKEWTQIFDIMHVRRERTSGPGVEHRVIPVELDKEQLKAYRQLAEHSIAEIGDDVVMAADTMTLRHSLNQIAFGTPVLQDGKVVALEMPSAKIEKLFEVLAENDTKAIVVVEGRLSADLVMSQLAERDVRAVSILGGMTQEQHVDAEREFNEGDARVIVINKAGAFGKELPAAKRTIVLEQSFDYKFAAQSRARNTSDAQDAETVDVIDIFAKGTLEEAVREAYLHKDEMLHERLKDTAWIRQSMYGA